MYCHHITFDEREGNVNVFCWKCDSLIQIDGTKLVLIDIGAHLCLSFGSSTYWSVSRITRADGSDVVRCAVSETSAQ